MSNLKTEQKRRLTMSQLDVIYGDTKIQVPADTPIESLKVAMAENFPELKDASVVTTDSAVVFSAKAGTKGTVVFH